MAGRVLLAKVSGGLDGWMDDVKVYLGSGGMTLVTNDRKEWRALTHMLDDLIDHFSLVTVFFLTAPRALMAYHLEKSGMMLHDTV